MTTRARRLLAALALPSLGALAACAGSSSQGGTARQPTVFEQRERDAERRATTRMPRYPTDFSRMRPLTRAERTRFAETSHYTDVVRFLDSLPLLGAKMTRGVLGKTVEGRDIPYVVASRPLVSTPAEAKRLHRPIVFVQGNIHAGEVEGKEALQSLLRDLLLENGMNVLDSIVLVAVPIYNADGNEKWGPQARQRAAQNGPEQVGQRPNADTLDLNRDYIKAEAPETRAALAFLNAWEPDVFVDLHTTNGSYHGYALTYAPPLNPAALITGPFVRDTLLPDVRRRMRVDYGTETFDYGNFPGREGGVDSLPTAWLSYDHRPRFGTNYYGLRGRIAVLSEAYSHDPFERRIASTYHFVREVLSLIAENAEDVTELSAEADRRTTGWGTLPASSPAIPLRARLVQGRREGVRVEVVERTGDTLRTEAGMPRGLRRTGRFRTPVLPIHDRFEPTLTRRLPYAWAIPADQDSVVVRLRRHGVVVERVESPQELQVERFTMDSVVRSPTRFQKHFETRLEGRWAAERRTLPAGSYVVRTGQPLAILAHYLLEPESDDGLATWNGFGPLRAGEVFPVARVVQPVVGGVREVRD
jgi:hypothetical protein